MYIFTVANTIVNLFTQVYEMFDLDPASWAALVAQLVRASVRSAECREFKSQLIFSFASGACLSFFRSFHLKSSCTCTCCTCMWHDSINDYKDKALIKYIFYNKVNGNQVILFDYELRSKLRWWNSGNSRFLWYCYGLTWTYKIFIAAMTNTGCWSCIITGSKTCRASRIVTPYLTNNTVTLKWRAVSINKITLSNKQEHVHIYIYVWVYENSQTSFYKLVTLPG